MSDKEVKIPSFSEADGFAISDINGALYYLDKDIRCLQYTFPETYKDIPAYDDILAEKESYEHQRNVKKIILPQLWRLDKALETIIEKTGLKFIGYGYSLIRADLDEPRLYKDAITLMLPLLRWNKERIEIGREPYMKDMENSIIAANDIYFAFPYDIYGNGAVIYMNADTRQYGEKDCYIDLKVGLQVIDNFDAYRKHKDNRKFVKIQIAQFSWSYMSESRMDSLPYNDDGYWDDLTYLNQGYCQGIRKIICDIINGDYADVFVLHELNEGAK